MAELSLWLDYYDDIYSDFDSRQYTKRRISEDFLYELKDAFKYKKEKINDLFLHLPQEKRDEGTEKIISPGLKSFFIAESTARTDKCRKKLNRGIMLGIAGIIIMTLNAFAGFKGVHTFFVVGLRVLLEPAGWFLLWTSLRLFVL